MCARNEAGLQGGHFPGQPSGRHQTGLPLARAWGRGWLWAEAPQWAQGTRHLLQPAEQKLGNTWELVRVADSQVFPQTCRFIICILTRYPGDSYAHFSVRSPVLQELARTPLQVEKEKDIYKLPVTNKSWGCNMQHGAYS